MSKDPTRTSGGSWALQGCLFGAVGLFVVLLLVMIFLAYRRFQENTQTTEPTPISTIQLTDPTGSRADA
ncbi:MAG: hypothetical protein WD766_06560 [Gemmatimonadota bacterium]